MFLLLIQMKYFLDLVAQSLAIGRLAVAAVLLFIYVSGSTSLQLCQLRLLLLI